MGKVSSCQLSDEKTLYSSSVKVSHVQLSRLRVLHTDLTRPLHAELPGKVSLKKPHGLTGIR